MVEHLPSKQEVTGSTPVTGFLLYYSLTLFYETIITANTMRKGKKKIVSFKNDFTPWQQKTITDTDRHFQDNFTSLSLYHSTHSAQNFAGKTYNSKVMISLAQLQANRQNKNDPKIHSQTLSVIKDYCTIKEEPKRQRKQFYRKTKSAQLITKIKQNLPQQYNIVKLKKASIVDLSMSLVEQLKPAQKEKTPKTMYGSRILKIKNQLRNQKVIHRKSADKHQKDSCLALQPQSRSLPIRRLIMPYSKKKANKVFPKTDFGSLLSDYLAKI